MAYQAQITRSQPTYFLFLIDQSSSMAQPFGTEDRGQTKAEGVARALNDLLRSLVIMSSKSDGVRHYFDVSVLGYGEYVGPAFGGPLAGRDIVATRELAEYPARLITRVEQIEDSVGNLREQTVRYPVWVEPKSGGNTPMCQALNMARGLLNRWLPLNMNAFPPVVVHITDGEATDGDPAPPMRWITDLATLDGNVLLFNIHLSSNRAAHPASFPDRPDDLPDSFARLLFERSSVLTPFMRSVAWDRGIIVTPEARGFVLNADSALVVTALEIGTRPGNLW